LTASLSSKELGDRLRRHARRAGVNLRPQVAAGLIAYFELLARWNERINLTSLAAPEDAIDRLLIEPLLAARHLGELPPDSSLLDVGSGGGSPAIPLKLAIPGLRLWMVESKARKAAFLREAVRHLALANVRVETSRFEELLARPEMHESMDLLSVRAVRVEPRTLMSMQAFLKAGGQLLWFRSATGPDRVDAIPPLAWEATHPLVAGESGRLVILRKQVYR
jgi:16S rRNA (guanine527-N7)-methyltransferase